MKGFVCLVGLYSRAGGLGNLVGGYAEFLWVSAMVGAGSSLPIMQSTPFISSSYFFDNWVLISWERCGSCAVLLLFSDLWMFLWHVFRCCVVSV